MCRRGIRFFGSLPGGLSKKDHEVVSYGTIEEVTTLFPLGVLGARAMMEMDYTGQHIGAYLLLSQFARGAFSNVYLAKPRQPFERTVVVKLPHTYRRSTQETEHCAGRQL